MAYISKTPAGSDLAGASRVRCGGWTHPLDNRAVARTQFVIGAHYVRPEWAAMLAALAFGGGAGR